MTKVEKLESLRELIQDSKLFLEDPATKAFPIARAEAELMMKDAELQILNLEQEGC